MNLLEGKICIVTGGGRGIGRATALKFADEGAKVVIAEFDEKSGQATADEINGLFVQANVGDKKSVDELFKAVMDAYGRVDVLINNAGILKDSTLVKMEEDQFDDVINVNLQPLGLVQLLLEDIVLKQEQVQMQ